MPLEFNTIPIDILTPGQFIEFDNSKANRGTPPQPHKILVVGQRLAAGAVAAAVPTLVTTAAQAVGYFGRGSMLAAMFAALKAVNTTTETWAVALDDNGAGVAATGSLKFGGAATEAGTLNFYIAFRRVQIAVAAAATSASLATALAAAITADLDMPVTAAVDGVDTTKVNITARHKGLLGNDIDLRVNYFDGEITPKGMIATIVAMTGGTANPDIGDVIDVLGDVQYNTIANPWNDAANLTALETELERRWGPLVMIEGIGFTALRGTVSALGTAGSARNSVFTSIMGEYASPSTPWEWAAAVAGVAAFYGSIDPARPFQTLKLTGIAAPREEDLFIREERDLLLHDGVATFKRDPGGALRIDRLVTTYKTDSNGVVDPSYRDVNTFYTLSYLRYSLRTRIALKFPRYKLADDGTLFGAGQAIVTPKIIRAEILALFREWEDAGLVENVDQFKSDLIVERDANDPNRVNALVPPDIVNQLVVFAAQIQFRL